MAKPEWPEVSWRIHIDLATFHDGVRVIEMPCCGFSFDAIHTEIGNSDYYTCPDCEPREENGEVAGTERPSSEGMD